MNREELIVKLKVIIKFYVINIDVYDNFIENIDFINDFSINLVNFVDIVFDIEEIFDVVIDNIDMEWMFDVKIVVEIIEIKLVVKWLVMMW